MAVVDRSESSTRTRGCGATLPSPIPADGDGERRPSPRRTLSALIWANLDASSYDSVWQTHLSIHVGQAAVSLDLRDWINSG